MRPLDKRYAPTGGALPAISCVIPSSPQHVGMRQCPRRAFGAPNRRLDRKTLQHAVRPRMEMQNKPQIASSAAVVSWEPARRGDGIGALKSQRNPFPRDTAEGGRHHLPAVNVRGSVGTQQTPSNGRASKGWGLPPRSAQVEEEEERGNQSVSQTDGGYESMPIVFATSQSSDVVNGKVNEGTHKKERITSKRRQQLEEGENGNENKEEEYHHHLKEEDESGQRQLVVLLENARSKQQTATHASAVFGEENSSDNIIFPGNSSIDDLNDYSSSNARRRVTTGNKCEVAAEQSSSGSFKGIVTITSPSASEKVQKHNAESNVHFPAIPYATILTSNHNETKNGSNTTEIQKKTLSFRFSNSLEVRGGKKDAQHHIDISLNTVSLPKMMSSILPSRFVPPTLRSQRGSVHVMGEKETDVFSAAFGENGNKCSTGVPFDAEHDNIVFVPTVNNEMESQRQSRTSSDSFHVEPLTQRFTSGLRCFARDGRQQSFRRIGSMNAHGHSANGPHQLRHTLSRRSLLDDPFARRAAARERHKRRLKKDAQSLYSVELPVFDGETGILGCGYIFPSRLSLDEVMRCVLEQERGEARTRTSGLGIQNFLKNFEESREMIMIYFWYIVAHIRRVRAEMSLVTRHSGLERAFKSMFPLFKAELPPISQLEDVVLEAMRSMQRDAKSGLAEGRGRSASIISVASVTSELCGSRPNGHANTHSPGDSLPCTAAGRHSRMRTRQRIGESDLTAWVQDAAAITQFADAIDLFAVAHLELYELANFEMRCFDRLSLLFGRAFERLEDEKDEVLFAYMTIVSHAVYFVLVYCFPNDEVANLFSSTFRTSLYRIFFYWCSGLLATYVRVIDWPSPLNEPKPKPLSPPPPQPVPSFLRVTTQKSSLPVPSTEMEYDLEKSPGEANGLENSVSLSPSTALNMTRISDVPSFESLPLLGSSRKTSGDDRLSLPSNLQALSDTSFDDVDVEVANGHHRLVLEFSKYTKHVDFLVQELETRTTGPGTAGCRDANKDNERKNGKKGPLRPSTKLHQCQTKFKSAVEGNAPLPNISPRRGKPQGGNTGGVLASCPLKYAPLPVRRYILHQGDEPLRQVPHPPLDEDPLTARAAWQNVDKLPGLLTPGQARPVKIPLPIGSPFFLHFASRELHLRLPNPETRMGSSVYSTARGSSSVGVSRRNSASSHALFFPDNSVTQVPESGKPARLRAMEPVHAVPTHAMGNAPQRALNVMLIPPSDARLRPLQFKGIAREVQQRQRALEDQLRATSSDERQMRRRFNVDSQQSHARMVTLMQSAQRDRAEGQSFRRNSAVKRRKRNDGQKNALK